MNDAAFKKAVDADAFGYRRERLLRKEYGALLRQMATMIRRSYGKEPLKWTLSGNEVKAVAILDEGVLVVRCDRKPVEAGQA